MRNSIWGLFYGHLNPLSCGTLKLCPTQAFQAFWGWITAKSWSWVKTQSDCGFCLFALWGLGGGCGCLLVCLVVVLFFLLKQEQNWFTIEKSLSFSPSLSLFLNRKLTTLCHFYTRFADQFGARAALILSCVSGSLFFLLLSLSTSIPMLFLSRLPAVFMHGLPGKVPFLLVKCVSW